MQFKESWILIGLEASGLQLKNQIFPRRFCHNSKHSIFGLFLGPTNIFYKIRASWLFLLYDYLTSCKKIRKNYDLILRPGVANGRTDERTNGQMNSAKFIGHCHQRECTIIVLEKQYLLVKWPSTFLTVLLFLLRKQNAISLNMSIAEYFSDIVIILSFRSKRSTLGYFRNW